MPIYSKPTKELIKEFIENFSIPPKQGFGLIERKIITEGGHFTRHEIISWFNNKYPKIKRGTITAHLILLSTNAPSRVHYKVKSTGEHDLLFQVDSSNFRLYDKEKDPQPIYEKDNITNSFAIDDEDVEDKESKKFAYEKDLQNYLFKNLHEIEDGLRLYEDEEINGIEFPVGRRFIDILAIDRGNNFVVIELKVSRGSDKTIGQLLYYMAWIEKEHAEQGQTVRGVIVANNISEDLKLASSRLSHVELFEYNLSFTLNKIRKDILSNT